MLPRHFIPLLTGSFSASSESSDDKTPHLGRALSQSTFGDLAIINLQGYIDVVEGISLTSVCLLLKPVLFPFTSCCLGWLEAESAGEKLWPKAGKLVQAVGYLGHCFLRQINHQRAIGTLVSYILNFWNSLFEVVSLPTSCLEKLGAFIKGSCIPHPLPKAACLKVGPSDF